MVLLWVKKTVDAMGIEIKIGYPQIQWLIMIFPIKSKWFVGGTPHF